MKSLLPDLEFLTEYCGTFGKILCKCKKCGFLFLVAPDHLYRETKCPNCSSKHKKRTEESYILDLNALNSDIELVKGTYINTKNLSTFHCKICNYTWETNAGKVIWENRGRPIYNKSKRERLISNFLRKNNIDFIPLYIINVDFLNRKSLNIDFYLPDYNLFIEYNGEQHYIPVKHFGGEIKLKDLLLRDEQLREYCNNNKIRLLEIPYTLTDLEIYELLTKLKKIS